MISSSRLSLVSVLMMMMVSVVNASSFNNNIRKPSFITSSSCLSSWNKALNIRGGEVTQVDTMEDLNSIILSASASGKLVVIDFSATWCPPCKAIFPLYQELSEEYADEDSAIFLKVDVDENPEAAANFQVSAMPTFLFIKGGEVIDRMMGADPNKLQALIQEYS